MASENKKDILLHNLPCIRYGNRYILFSPYSQQIVSLSPHHIEDPSVLKKLKDYGFWGKLKKQNSDGVAKLGLILTTDCNLKCKYCFSRRPNKPHYMSEDLAFAALRKTITSSTRIVNISFFGGEPTLNFPVLQKVVNHLNSSKVGVKYHITTNGIMPDHVLDFLLGNNFSISLSSDGPAQINDIQRPMKNHGKPSPLIEETIVKLVRNNAHFQVRMTITRYNVNYLAESIEYFASLNVKYIHFEAVNIERKNIEPNFISPTAKDYIANVKKGLDVAQKYGVFIINSAFMNLLTPTSYFCTIVGGEKYLFTPDGGISACYRVQDCRHPQQDFIVGRYNTKKDIFKVDSLKIDRFNNLTVENLEDCQNCFALYICGSGCPYRNLTTTGNLQHVNKWACNVKKGLIHNAIIRIYRSSKNGRPSVVLGTYLFEEK